MEAPLKILSGDELKAKRHELFLALANRALVKLDKDETKEACELTSAALKTIQEADETSIKVEGEETHVDEFRDLVAKAYAESNDQSQILNSQ